MDTFLLSMEESIGRGFVMELSATGIASDVPETWCVDIIIRVGFVEIVEIGLVPDEEFSMLLGQVGRIFTA